MKITVTIDLEDHPEPAGSRLGYNYAVDRMHEIELRVPAEPPFPAGPYEVMKWQEDKAKARKLTDIIAGNIAAALTNALERPRAGR